MLVVSASMLGLAVFALVAFGFWASSTITDRSGAKPLESGAKVESFTLADALTGRQVSLSDYLGKQEVVVVTLMGGF